MQSKLLCTDVLAIRCTKDFILVGIGSTLHVFDKDTNELVKKMPCLYPHNIHGIVDGPDDKLAIFGANSLRLYSINIENKDFVLNSCSDINELSDWIIGVKWFNAQGTHYLSVLFAHNYVDIYNISCGYQKSFGCQEKCILYGGSLSVQNNGNLIVLSGTVFQEILIWEVDHDSTELRDIPVLHRLTGHNGVIFSVIYEPRKQLICSTSDDRTVRLWQVHFYNSLESGREDWKSADVKLLRTAFGHSARVWRSVIKDDTLITIGEDSLICTWSLKGELLNKVHAHHGSAIWSIEVDDDRILTGGADGAVHLWSLNNDYTQRMIPLPDTNAHSTLKSVCYLKSDSLLIFNEAGELLIYDKGVNYPRETLLLEKYGSYCVVQVSQCRSYVAIASRNGQISVYKEIQEENNKKLVRVLEEQLMSGKVFSVHWLSENSMIACGENGILKMIEFTDEGEMKTKSVYELPSSRERWLTAARMYNGLLICGDRAGHLHVYTINDSISVDLQKPVQTFYKVHGRIGIQTFDVLNGKLMSAGRDGTLRFYKMKEHDLCDLHREKMPMDWIGKTLTIDEKDVLILGFKEAEFIIYSMFHRRILGRIACGGGHRSWDCVLSNESLKFAFIRNKQVFEIDYRLRTSESPVLLGGFHSKEVYCVRFVEQFEDYSIFISGGEDSSLRLTCVSNNAKSEKCGYRTLGVFDGHISSIKSIAITRIHHHCPQKKYLAFSAGGRAQIKVWEVSINFDSNAIEPVSCSDLASHLLYGLDKYRKKPWQDKEESYVMEAETRYMDIDIYRTIENSPYVFLFTACADGYLRIFLYSINDRTIDLVGSTKYANRCILRVHTLSFEEKVIVLTMSTDGALRFFDFTRFVEEILNKLGSAEGFFQEDPFMELKLHQCGINSFDISELDKGRYILATGGDDNLLSLIHFQLIHPHDKVSFELLSKWSTSDAHSTQISGVQLNKNNTVCSVGMDQRVILHRFELRSNLLSVTLIRESQTSVADVQGLVQFNTIEKENSLACVYGKGFEVLSLQQKQL